MLVSDKEGDNDYIYIIFFVFLVMQRVWRERNFVFRIKVVKDVLEKNLE